MNSISNASLTMDEIRRRLAAKRLSLQLSRRGGYGVEYPFGAYIVDRDTGRDVAAGQGHSLRDAILEALEQVDRLSDCEVRL